MSDKTCDTCIYHFQGLGEDPCRACQNHDAWIGNKEMNRTDDINHPSHHKQFKAEVTEIAETTGMSDKTCHTCVYRRQSPGVHPCRVCNNCDAWEGDKETVVADDINHPSHYKQFKVEVIEITETMSFCLGNVVKYALRAGHKVGDNETPEQARLRDLKKAQWYLNREIARLENNG